eukprot:15270785-Alexandrium_andersonii.AAC.1
MKCGGWEESEYRGQRKWGKERREDGRWSWDPGQKRRMPDADDDGRWSIATVPSDRTPIRLMRIRGQGEPRAA